MMAAGRKIDVRVRRADSIWPSRVQLLLLRAALGRGDAARAAWSEWQQTENLAALDSASWRLLPLAWRNLSRQGVQDEVLEECRGFYRFHWAHNQQLLQRTRRWVPALQARGWRVMLLKGLPLALDAYGDLGVRPMADVDLMVPRADAAAVAGALQAEGWTPQFEDVAWSPEVMRYAHAFNWRRGEERLDLHWQLFARQRDAAVTDEFWAHARPLALGETTVLQLCPEDALLHVCSHGVQYAEESPLRWLADAAAILAQSGRTGLAWERVERLAARTGSALVLRHGLEYAAAELQLPVPAEVLARLRTRRASWLERADFRRSTTVPSGNRWSRAFALTRLLWRVGGRGSPRTRWDRISRFLCTRWEAPGMGAVVRLACRKVWRGEPGTYRRNGDGSPRHDR